MSKLKTEMEQSDKLFEIKSKRCLSKKEQESVLFVPNKEKLELEIKLLERNC